MLPRLAWTSAALTLLLVLADAVITAQSTSLTSRTAVAIHGFPLVDGAVLGSAVMGALVVSRYERHPIGWLLSAVGLAGAVSLVTEAYAYWVQVAGGPGSSSLGGVSSWVSALVGGQLALSGLALMFLLAPDGHLASPRWRWAVWVTGVGELLCLAAVLSVNPTDFRLQIGSETFGPVRSTVISLGFVAITVGVVASVVSTVRRLRRSRGEQRQQVALIALAAALIAAGVLCLFVVQLLNGGEQTWLAGLPLFIAYFLLPILLAVAVLRYRLYDVDVIIDRTVVLVAGTAFAAVGYTTLVVLVGNVLGDRAGGFWLSLLVTALVALAFQPLRRRVAHLADRLAYGARAQPYQELADFSRRLDETPVADSLMPLVAAAAGQSVAARRATVTLEPSVPGLAPAAWGEPVPDGTPGHRFPVRDAEVELGSIEVFLPRGRRLRPADARRLEALADQASVAFRNTALEAQLAGHVAALDRTTTELSGARTRIIEADDAVRRELEAAISRDVVPHLQAVAAELGCLTDDAAVIHTDALVDTVNEALEALRDLTRGVFPTQLENWGLEPALRSVLGRAGHGTALVIDESAAGRRFGAPVETAAYLCCVEASRADPPPVAVELRLEELTLVETITGVTLGGPDLQGVTDRVDALGGDLLAEGDRLVLRLPVAVASPAPV